MVKNNGAISVLIGEDQEVFRSGLQTILVNAPQQNIQVIGEANNGIDLLDAVHLLQPDVVLTNVTLPYLDCKEVCAHIKNNFVDIGLVTYSSRDDHSLIFELFDIGINAHLLKKTPKTEIIEAVHAASTGNMYYSSNISNALVKGLGKQKQAGKKTVAFSDKELSIIRLIGRQYTTKEIANELALATRTVEDHSKRIKAKTGAINIVGIVLFGIKEGIIKFHEVQC